MNMASNRNKTGVYSAKDKRPGLFSRLTFGWLSEIVNLGHKQPLEQDHLGRVDDLECTEDLVGRLECGWLTEQQKSDLTEQNPRLWKAVLNVLKPTDYLTIFFLCLLESCSRIFQPVFLSLLLSALQSGTASRQGEWGVVLACGLSACSVIQAFARNHYMRHSLLAAVHIRAALTGLVYKKILTLRENTLAAAGSSFLLNLVSKDMQPFREAIPSICDLLLVPFEITAVSVLLCWLVDWRALAGIFYVILVVMWQVSLGPSIKRLRDESTVCTDARLRLVGDSADGIRLIKGNSWEDKIERDVTDVRRKELKLIGRKYVIQAMFNAHYSSYTVMTTLIALSTMLLSGVTLTAQNVFTAISLFAVVQENASFTSAKVVYNVFQMMSSFDRIRDFLLQNGMRKASKMASSDKRTTSKQKQQLVLKMPRETSTPNSKSLQTVSSTRNGRKSGMSLRGFSTMEHEDALNDLDFGDKELIGLIGPVGSGKTTILQIIAGELSHLPGRVRCRADSLVYVSQVPWLFSGTVRENILFGEEFNEEKYRAIVEATTLTMDLRQLPKGDMTQIGERGVSLSGGQRARVSLARALYADADIYLLDDPLSAVDLRVGNEILRRCIYGHLSDRLRILVTHQMRYVQNADRVLGVKNGQLYCPKDCDQIDSLSKVTQDAETRQQKMDSSGNCTASTKQGGDGGDLSRAAEDRRVGRVSMSLYWRYLKQGAPGGLVIILLMLLGSPEGISLASNVLLETWTKARDEKEKEHLFFRVYVALCVAVLLLSPLRAFVFYLVTLRSSESLHRRMLRAVLRAPVVFFDTNPTGRLLNRFAKDIGWIDETLPYYLLLVMQRLVFFFGAIGLVSIASPWLNFSSVPFVLASVYFCWRAFGPARDAKRLEAISTSPIYAHFSETVEGILTIRSYRRQLTFTESYYRLQDDNNKAFAVSLLIYRWIGLRLALLASLMVTAAVFGSVLFIKDPALSGLIITYSIQLMDRLPRLLHWLNVVDQQMVSVERVFAYTELAPEPGYSRVTRPPLGWPQEGTIELRHLSLRYTPRAPEVLKNLNFTIAAGEKVGIVGRTGAGKSSLASALLRMPDPQGDVIIDDVPTSDMNIRDYRRAITLIPQSPFLFNDTLRRNIDPTDGYSDAEVRHAMDQVGLGRVLQGRGGLLLSDMVTERGANFSVGERQLICLARALLSKTKIILLDEATANVDLHTDRLIHSVIRREFKYSTVLMIAHRLETVLECDRIMVLHDGEVVEFGKPNDLLQQDGYFRQLLSVEH